jgi:hypothetical protein
VYYLEQISRTVVSVSNDGGEKKETMFGEKVNWVLRDVDYERLNDDEIR